MSVSNLVYPQWHPVSCNKNIKVDVICTKTNYKTIALIDSYTRNQSINTKQYSCANNQILFNNNRLYFTRDKTTAILTKENLTFFFDIEDFQNKLLVYISKVNQARILFAFPVHQKNFTDIFYEYNSLNETFNTYDSTPQWTKLNVLYVMRKNQERMNNISMLIYKCGTGEYITKVLLHDTIEDCISGDDETSFSCIVNGQKINESHSQTSCLTPNCKCPDLYYQRPQGGCFPYSSKCNEVRHWCEVNLLRSNNTINIFHTRLAVINRDFIMTEGYKNKKHIDNRNQKYNLYTDCTEIELELMYQNKLYFSRSCQNPDEIQCTYGCDKCFPVHKMCVYELDKTGNLMHCPSGAHLKNCTHMECNNMFKCYKHYCIPFR